MELDREENGWRTGASPRKWNITTPLDKHFVCVPYGLSKIAPETCIRYRDKVEFGIPRYALCQTCKQGEAIREAYPELLI